MDMYARNILDHYKNPHNKGSFSDASKSFKSVNSSCGDEITAFVKIKGDKLEKITFDGHGCAIAMAATSILSDVLVGKTMNEIIKLDLLFVQSQLGINISARRHKCALIGLRSIQGALNLYLQQNK